MFSDRNFTHTGSMQGYLVFDINASMLTYLNYILSSGSVERNPISFVPVGFHILYLPTRLTPSNTRNGMNIEENHSILQLRKII